MHHAFVIEAEPEQGIEIALAFIEKNLGLKTEGNPDVITRRYGLLSVEDARRIGEIAAQKPLTGARKAIVIAANRTYHEAQNALLKVFEEPSEGTFLFLVLPSLGALLPTLRSRVQILETGEETTPISEEAGAFLRANREKRGAIAKKLATGKDEDERREHRDEALAIVNGIEAAAYLKFKKEPSRAAATLLEELAALRGYLHERSAPVRMILEHLALVAPKDLL